MILFHSCELCLTQSKSACMQIRRILDAHDIVYDVTTIDRNPIGGGNGAVREGYKSLTLYKIKVKKKDYVKAKHLIAQVNLMD